MGFRNFRLVCTIRTVLLFLTITLFLYLLWHTELHATTAIAAVVIIYQIWALIHYVERSNRDLSRFLMAIRHSDFASTFPDHRLGGSHRELRQAFDLVLRDFRKTRMEKEEHFRYLQTVVQHIGIGLIAFDTGGDIDFMNNSARRLLGVPGARNIARFSRLSPLLHEKLAGIRSGQKELLKVDIQGEMMQLSLAATEFKLGQRSIKLVSLHNIAGELAEREMEAWQQLVRVLTHEIMNSVTPIASLSSTAGTLLDASEQQSKDPSAETLSKPQLSDVRRAVYTIKKRSEGLLHFVDAYRTLTRIPKPDFQIIPVAGLLERVRQLALSRPDATGLTISTEAEPTSLELTADPDLVEQVLINLTTNALQAIGGRPDGQVMLSSRLNERGRVIIQVSDNGPGISPEAQESVFVPFFTTKPDGTGIGLSLSRQIMRLHRGEISVTSAPGELTTFTLRF